MQNSLNTLLKIGEMAELNHISTQTLRLYSKNKLLEPQYMDAETGYRYYTWDQCAKLDLIRALKSCHLSLRKIREIFELSSEESLLQILDEQIGALSEEIYHSSVSRNNLLRIQKNLQTLNALPPFGQVFFEYVAERKLDVQQTEFDFFAQGYRGYENMLRYMQNYLHEKKLPPSYFINVGTLMDRENFMRGTYASQSAFIFVDDLYPDTGSLRILPQNMYLSVASDDPSLEAAYAGKLYAELQKQNLLPCGDYICEVLTQFPLNHSKQLIYKIQIPVRRRRVSGVRFIFTGPRPPSGRSVLILLQRRVTIGLYRKRRGRTDVKTATAPPDLRQAAGRRLLPQGAMWRSADPADAGRIRGHPSGGPAYNNLSTFITDSLLIDICSP